MLLQGRQPARKGNLLIPLRDGDKFISSLSSRLKFQLTIYFSFTRFFFICHFRPLLPHHRRARSHNKKSRKNETRHALHFNVIIIVIHSTIKPEVKLFFLFSRARPSCTFMIANDALRSNTFLALLPDRVLQQIENDFFSVRTDSVDQRWHSLSSFFVAYNFYVFVHSFISLRACAVRTRVEELGGILQISGALRASLSWQVSINLHRRNFYSSTWTSCRLLREQNLKYHKISNERPNEQ